MTGQTSNCSSIGLHCILLFLIILIIGYNPQVSGAIIPGGILNGDTVWTVTQSPYIIEGDVLIDHGVTLTIEPGVEVRFLEVNLEEGETNRAELIVKGKLLAVGTADYPIRFTADSKIPDMGSWGGIYLLGNDSKLEYVEIEYAMTGLTITSRSQVQWSKIGNNLEGGIIVKEGGISNLVGNELSYNRVGLFLAGSGVIEDNRFLSNSYGLLADGIFSLDITGNSFESNNYGIYLENLEPGNQLLANLISGNDYGIYLVSGIPPEVNYNDLYNNSIYDFYHLASSDVDARYNWWGTTDPGIISSYIYDQNDSPEEMIGYVDYSEYLGVSALAPTILNLVTEPEIIHSGVMQVTITFSKEMNTIVKPVISYGLVSPFTTFPVSPEEGRWLSYTQYRFNLDITESHPEGRHRFRIEGAESLDGLKLKTNINYVFQIDRTAPEISFNGETFAFSPNGDGKQDQLEANIYLNEAARMTYQITDNEAVVYGPIVGNNFISEGAVTWNGRNNQGSIQPEGEYLLEIVVEDQAGNQSTDPLVIPIIVDITSPLVEIDPIVGIKTDILPITGMIAEDNAPITHLSYRYEENLELISIGRVEGNKSGEIFPWDLSGLRDGIYELKILTNDLAGNDSTVFLEVLVDENNPMVHLTTPPDDAHLSGGVSFQGVIDDYFLKEWSVEIEVLGEWLTLTRGANALNGEIYFLDLESYSDGPYCYRILAEDQVGHVTELVQTLHVDNATQPEIRFFNLLPEFFSPNGDGIKDCVSFLVSYSEIVDWQLDIHDDTGLLVFCNQGTDQLMQNQWDGKDANGNRVKDGIYNYCLSYIDQVGHEGEKRMGELTIDTKAPELKVEPLPQLTNLSLITLEGEVDDYYQVLVNGNKIVLDQGKFNLELQLVEGHNQFTVVAEDLAGNRAVQDLEVISDTTPPKIYLDPMKSQTNQETIKVCGYIDDENLADSQLNILNQLGNQELELNLDEDNKFQLDLSLILGINYISIDATDSVGNESRLSVQVEYLPTIPEIYLLKPATPFLKGSDFTVILLIEEGTEPLDVNSIDIEIDGQSYPYQWDGNNKLIKLDVQGLEEGTHYLRAGVKNTLGESAGDLLVELVVDLSNPLIRIDQPDSGMTVDGWDGELAIVGFVEDVNLERIIIQVKPAPGIQTSGKHSTVLSSSVIPTSVISGLHASTRFISPAPENTSGTEETLLNLEVDQEKRIEGELTRWRIGEWPNGWYNVHILASDRAGRVSEVILKLEVRNTGLIQGQIRGNLDKITDSGSTLLLVVGQEIYDYVPFNLSTGEFSKRVLVGRYDLVFVPWGYKEQMIKDLLVQVGQTYSGLNLNFQDDLDLLLNPGKQLLSVPFQLESQPSEIIDSGLTIDGWDRGEYYTFQDWILLKPGRGYWISGDEKLSLKLKGEALEKMPYRISVKTGWNLIGTPFNYHYPMDGLSFYFNGVEYSYKDAVNRGKVDAGVWCFDKWYRQVRELKPWQGYWIYVIESGEVLFEPENVILPYSQMGSPQVELNRVQEEEWKVQMKASIGTNIDLENYFGTINSGTEGYDPVIDLREPPGYSQYISLAFLDSSKERLTTSLQSPVPGSRGKRTWEMLVESPVTGWVRLAWELDPMAILSLEINDNTTGEKVNMLDQNSYEFYHQAGKADKFTIIAEKGSFEVKKIYNYPNPLSAWKRSTDLPGEESVHGEGTQICYLLTHDAHVKLDIYDVMKRPVKRFPIIKSGDPGGREGWNEIYWDGTNGMGEPVANGVYLLKATFSYGKIKQVKTVRMAVINRR